MKMYPGLCDTPPWSILKHPPQLFLKLSHQVTHACSHMDIEAPLSAILAPKSCYQPVGNKLLGSGTNVNLTASWERWARRLQVICRGWKTSLVPAHFGRAREFLWL